MSPTKRLYELTEEHGKELKPWADRWIANAISTNPMLAEDRSKMEEAINGLYDAASLPRPKHIVFVPSPFVLAFAGGYASAIWWLARHRDATRDATIDATRAATSDATRDATIAATRDATIAATRDATIAATIAATRAATIAATIAATRAATSDATSDATIDATIDATRDATIDATIAATIAATRAATRAATSDATSDATIDATIDATRDATIDATIAATIAATRAATIDATRAATRAATSAATRDATSAATRDATRAATIDATRAATSAATRAATSADDWYVVPVAELAALAAQLVPDWPSLAVECAKNASYWYMWDGGNQWSGWAAYVSFFRHVVKLEIDYSKWQHYETAAMHGGPRVMHPDFCMISDRPVVLTVDDRNRPHNADGPFCMWRDGTRLYSWHGIRVPAHVIEAPESITVDQIEHCTNQEIRRVMIERYGQSRYLLDSGAEEISRDECGTLYRKDIDGDEPLVMVRVLNATPEPDGSLSRDEALAAFPGVHVAQVDDGAIQMIDISAAAGDARFKDYFLRVDPSLTTARAAVAWTFDVPAKSYRPSVQA